MKISANLAASLVALFPVATVLVAIILAHFRTRVRDRRWKVAATIAIGLCMAAALTGSADLRIGFALVVVNAILLIEFLSMERGSRPGTWRFRP